LKIFVEIPALISLKNVMLLLKKVFFSYCGNDHRDPSYNLETAKED